ncbi:MAG: class II fructose-bisphosphate aldolase [Gammaproteobacteria bacterium]|nr:class II fructose-bisphosphate aldolase [Gammaproteobacteria bacterium]
MPVVDMKDMLQHAYQHGYAVGAFEVTNLDSLEGIMMAAEQARAPVILSLAESHFEYYDFELLIPAVEVAAKRSLVPVAIHFDHATSLESAVRGINQGCNGVLVDLSHQDFSENTRTTKQVVDTAHACGIAVEGELGYIPGVEGQGAEHYPGDLAYTSVAEAKAYVERTGVDFLAVSIGTVHGHMKGKPRLDYQRLKQINESLGIPLVIHGGSGLSDDQFHRLICHGVAKINCFTALSDVEEKQLRKNTKKTSSNGYTRVQKDIKQAIAAEVERCMRLWGAAGRAAEVLTRCQSWTPVEHILIYKAEGINLPQVETIMAEGCRMFSSIPGVREVFISKAGQDSTQQQYTWLVRFCHSKIADNHQQHPAYISFTNNLSRSTAEKCSSINFQAAV